MNDLRRRQINDEGCDNDAFSARAKLCNSVMDLIKETSDGLIILGFSPQIARFDCLHTVKMIVDKLFDECDVGNARHDWYREYVRLELEKRKSPDS